jgi:glycosyltransferase involved in cell wall biosynthesis
MMNFSIVTVSCNQAKFLPLAIASVARQMGAQDEHIIVDPGSTDDSRRLILAQAEKDARYRFLFEKDRGAPDGLNKGFKIAMNELLAYVNSDDWLLPGALDYARWHFNRKPETDVLIGAIKISDESGKLNYRGRVADFPTPTRLVNGTCQYYQQGTFFRRTAFQRTGGFNPENRTCWDRELIADLAVAGARFSLSNSPLGAFRIHGQSITGSGQNGAAYAADSKRIQCKVQDAFGIEPSVTRARWLRWEARFNPVRWIRQLHPIPRT